jgi:hypothetical protein
LLLCNAIFKNTETVLRQITGWREGKEEQQMKRIGNVCIGERNDGDEGTLGIKEERSEGSKRNEALSLTY